MTTLIETLNRWGEAAIPLAGQMLWQTSLLIIVLLALDLLLRQRIRAGFRYALWMLLLVKLVLPPSLALPTGAGYWIERPVKAEAPVEPPVAEVAVLPPPATEFNHTADSGIIVDADFFDHLLAEAMADAPPAATTIEFPVEPEPAIQLTWHGQLLAAWLAGTWLLLGWMLWRWRWVTRLVRASEPAPADLQALLADLRAENVSRAACPTTNVSPAACRQFPQTARTAEGSATDHERKGDTPVAQSRVEATGVSPFRFFATPPTIPLRLTDAAMSPAVCGLFRPVILLPRKLVGKLSREQLGTVLLHELIHLRRRDLWVNCAQTLLQIAAWWHPLLWLANARIRRVREEAVDEAVACALRDDADAYPATLLEVAKLTFTRPLMTLGLVGILESKHALKQRIRRLLELPPLESTRLKWWQWMAVAAIALTALPMAEGQRSAGIGEDTTQWLVDAAFIQVSGTGAAFMLPRSRPDIETESVRAWIVQANGFQRIWSHAKNAQIGRGNRVVLLPAEMKVVPEGRRTVLGVTHQVVGMRANHDSAPPGYFVREGDERILQLSDQVPEQDLFSRLALSLKRGDNGGLRAEVSALSRGKHDLRGLPDPGNELREWTNFQFSAVLDLPADAVALALQPKQTIRDRTGGDIVLISLNRGSANFTEPVKQLRITVEGQLLWEGTPLDAGDLVQRVMDEAGRQNWLRVEIDAANAPHAVVTDVTRRLSWAQFWNVSLNPAVWEQAHGSVRFSVRPLAAAEVAPRLAELISDEILQMAVDALAEPDRALFPTVEAIRPLVGARYRQGAFPLEVAVNHADAKAAARAALEIAWAYRQGRRNVELAAEDALRIDDDPENPRRAGLRIRDITVAAPGNYRVGAQEMSLEAISAAIREEATRNPRFELVEVRTLDAQGKVITPPKDLREALRSAGARNIARYWEAFFGTPEDPAHDHGSLSPQSDPESPYSSPPLVLPHTNLTDYGAQMITSETRFPDPRVSGYRMVGLEPRFVLVPVEGLSRALGGQLPLARPLIIASNELAALTNSLIEAGVVDHSSAEPFRFSKMSGGVFHWQVAKGEPSQVVFQPADNPATNAAASSPRQIVFGARHGVPAFAPDWVPLTLLARPFTGDDDSLHSILSLATGEQQPVVLAQAEETIPLGGSLVWASTNEVRAGFAQAVILHNSGPPAEEADESADGAGEAAAKLQNAKELIEAGKLDEAEALLREAAKADSGNSMVSYYFAQINRARQPVEFDRAGLKEPLTEGQRKLMEKLNRITLDQVEFDNVPLVEVVKGLSDESRRRDPEKEGIRFMIASSIDVTDYEDDPADSTGRPPPTRPTTRLEIGDPKITINPPLSNARMIDVLNAVVRSAGEHVEFVVAEFAVVFRPKLPAQSALPTRVFRLNPNTFDRMKAAHTNAPIASGVMTNGMSVASIAASDYFKTLGVTFELPKRIYFNERTGLLMIKATLEDLEIIQRAVEKLVEEGEPQPSPPAEEVKKIEPRPEGTAHAAAPADSASALPRGLLVRGTNPEEIRARLNSTIVPQVEFKDTPLPEVLRTLQRFTRTPGPLLDEIRFTFGLYQDGQPRGRWPDGSLIEPEKIRINVTPPIENRSLAEVLTVVAARSSSPLFFTVESIGVVFRPQMVSERLETRTFRLEPNALYRAMEGAFSKSSAASTPRGEPVSAPIGPAPSPSGGGVRFLTVTNDMSVVNLAVREFFEAAGVKFELPKTLYFNDRTGLLMVRATLADLEIVQNTIEGMSREPAQINLEVRTIDADEAAVRAMGFDWIVNPAPELEPAAGSTITGILTDPQTRLALSALAERPGTGVRSLPSITTLSGRQTQIKLSDAASDSAGQPDPDSPQAGSVIDVIPYVSTDGHTIHMAVIPTVTQFLDPVGVENPVNVPSGADVVTSSKPLPRYRLRQIASNVNLWDGQTVVIVFPKAERIGRVENTGRSSADQNVRSLVFITPTIIDPAGNRVHSPEQMPFTQDQVPRQPGQE